MTFKEEIEVYSEYICNTELSPFETINDFHIRSRFQENFLFLSFEEKQLLYAADKKLFLHAKEIFEHIKGIYSFNSSEPLSDWWWHLDKVVSGELDIQQLLLE